MRYDAQARSAFLGLSVRTWQKIAVVTALFATLFWPNLRRLWLKTNPFTGEDNWKHAVLVPVIGLYFLFVHREELLKSTDNGFVFGPALRPGRLVVGLAMLVVGVAVAAVAGHRTGLVASLLAAPARGCALWGALVLLLDWSLATTCFGIAVYVYGIYPGQNDYLKDVGMIVCLFGIVLLTCGWGVMRYAWFPIAFLICAVPWPGLVYSWVAEPLQQMAATVAVGTLKMTGVDSVVSGTKIIIYGNPGQPSRVLNVAEACAGMRSLMTFISVAAALAFLSPRPLWQKAVVIASAVPIAIGCNVMRISGQGLLDHYASPKWSESFAHQFVGMMLILPAFFLILGVGWVLDQLFIEVTDEPDPAAPPTPAAKAAVAPARAVPAGIINIAPRPRVAAANLAPASAGPAPSANQERP